MWKKDLDKVDVLMLYFTEIINSMQVRTIKAHVSVLVRGEEEDVISVYEMKENIAP